MLEVQAAPIAEADGVGVQVSSRDITDRKRAEREVRTLSARLAGLVDGVPIGIVLEDEHRQVAMVNPITDDVELADALMEIVQAHFA